ncbi:head-tail connector protein [Granulicella mallensis]|uniref:Putative phiE125 gp8 family phage protein n=1 Tax=Granulicella mallensis TaxID=940614 RepID=A0A7W7ZUV1_9BACT|nr:head-tail connector protein [Granulicella mallensis]MBB5066148.1 putative phiE125 gp8 family phage protein [Granulicella mallensis]
MLNYQLVTPPAIEPVTLIQAKAQLRVVFSNDDDLISASITAAREMCEQLLNRAIYNQTYVLSLDQFNYGDWRSTVPMDRRNPLRFSSLWDSMALRLPMPRLVSVTSITYLDVNGTQQTLDPSTYNVDNTSEPARIVPSINLTWPTTDYYIPGSVRVTFVAGSYGDGVTVDTCPQLIKQAILLLVSHFYFNRTAVTTEKLSTIPLGVDALLTPYKFYWWM